MRTNKAKQLVKLAIHMQNSSGMSLDDICEYIADEFGEEKPSRRTAERLRDGLLEIFPDMFNVVDEDRVKRWKIPNITVNRLINFSSEELTELELARKDLKNKGLDARAKNIASLIDKLKPLTDKISRIEPDLEALCEAEGFAYRPSPRYITKEEVLSNIRIAIKGCNALEFNYIAKENNKTGVRKVYPYGIVYGHKNYLLAYVPEHSDYCYFILSNITNIKVSNDAFIRDIHFSLKDYCAKSFGIWQGEEPLNVVLKFNPDIRNDVLNFYFHSTQKIEEQTDRSIIVKFNAGGSIEICRHLFKWGKNVQILAPAELKDKYREMIEEVRNNL